MTLGELRSLVLEVGKRWNDETPIAVSSSFLDTSETIVGHFEPMAMDVEPIVILVRGKAVE